MNISDELTERAQIYLSMVDEADGHIGIPERDAERSEAHEQLMNELERCGIPFNSRFEARWIARWILSDNKPNLESTPALYWAKPNGDNDWFKELRHIPPDDNKEGWIPVMITYVPLDVQEAVFERNHTELN